MLLMVMMIPGCKNRLDQNEQEEVYNKGEEGTLMSVFVNMDRLLIMKRDSTEVAGGFYSLLLCVSCHRHNTKRSMF